MGRTEAGVRVWASRSVRWRIAAILGAAAAIAAVGAGLPWLGAKLGLLDWPQSSSWSGVLLGLLGGGIVLFEMALLPRKWLRGRPLVPTKWWMRFHIWLGLVCLPVILVHAGFGLGGPLPATTLVLFLLVTASGIWGLVMQQWLPAKLLAEVPRETIAAEIAFVGEKHAEEAERIVARLTIAPPGARRPAVVVGQPAADLAAFRDRVLLPYLHGSRGRDSPLAARAEAERRFAQLRDAIPEAATPAIDRLEELADLRRQWDFQARLNWWLHGWLVVHLPLSVAMTGLMLVHAVRALKYW